jgi:hypothetical protein
MEFHVEPPCVLVELHHLLEVVEVLRGRSSRLLNIRHPPWMTMNMQGASATG